MENVLYMGSVTDEDAEWFTLIYADGLVRRNIKNNEIHYMDSFGINKEVPIISHSQLFKDENRIFCIPYYKADEIKIYNNKIILSAIFHMFPLVGILLILSSVAKYIV